MAQPTVRKPASGVKLGDGGVRGCSLWERSGQGRSGQGRRARTPRGFVSVMLLAVSTALASRAVAEEPTDAEAAEASTVNTEGGAATAISAADSGDTNPSVSAAADTGEFELRLPPRRLLRAPTPQVKVLERQMRNLLSLREVIETSPIVVAGVKLYLDVHAIAELNRPRSTSQLTFGVAPDKLVVFGVF